MPAPAYLLEAVDRHVSEHGTRDGYLLAGARVPFVQHRGYLKSFTRAAQLAGIPEGFTPHSLRHVFASALLARGVPITDVAEWLGHRSIEVTYRIYGHLVPSAWGRAREALNAAPMGCQGLGRHLFASFLGRAFRGWLLRTRQGGAARGGRASSY
jgi:integrase